MKKQARFQPKSPRKKSTFVASDLPVVNLDARLKDIVRAHPEAFMRFFFSDLSREIDFVRGVEFLDKESQHLLPGYGKKGQRTGDLLMQWFLLTGERQFVLAHTEFQHKPKNDFQRRVFLTSVRVTEKYPDRELAQLAIYTGQDVPTAHNFYEIKFRGGETRHKFPSYIVRDQKRADLEASNNLFALVVLACLVNIEQKKKYKNDFEWLKKQKITLARLCFERGFTKYEIENLLIFVSFVIALPREEEDLYKKLINEIVMRRERSIAEENPIMADFFIRRYLQGKSLEERDAERDAERDEKLKAEIAAEVEAKAKIVAQKETERQHIQRMHQKGFAAEVIADVLDVEMGVVESIIKAMHEAPAKSRKTKTKPAKAKTAPKNKPKKS